MAERSQRDVRKTTSSLNSPWLSNALKSMGMASTDVIKDLMPAIGESYDSGKRAVSETAKSIHAMKSQNTNITKALSQNQAVKTAQTILKKAVDDVKSGKLYNTDIDFGDSSDEFDFNFDDLDFSDFGDEDSPAPDVNIVNNQIRNDGATIKAINQQTEYQVQAAKATVDTMVSLSASSMAKTAELGSAMLSELTSINKNLAALLDYQNTNMTKFIEASISYYEQSMTKVEESKSSTSFNQNNIFGSNGGLDFGAYQEFVKQNIANAKNNNMASSMISMVSMAPGMIVPTLIKEGMKSLVPTIMKESMAALDDAVKDTIPILLERIGNLRNSAESGIFGTITRFIGNTFGTQTVRKEKFDGSKIQKGPMPYNGVAQQTIIEIIPKYLRESNSYLKEIAEAVTGKSGKDIANSASGYNWEKGEFQSIDEIRDDLYSTISREVDSVFARSKFGKALDNNRNSLASEEDRRNYDDALTQLYAAMERKKGEIDFTNDDIRRTLMSDITASQNIKNSIEAFLLMNKDLQGSANNAKLQASIKKNTQMMALEEDINNNGLRQVMDEKYDDFMKRKFKSGSSSATIGGTIHTGKAELSVPTQLQNIYNLLERGIYVKTVKKLGKFTPATTTTSSTISSSPSSSDLVMDSASTEVKSVEDYKNAIQEQQNATADNNDAAMREAESGNVWQRANAKGASGIGKVTKVLLGIATGDRDMLDDALKQFGTFIDEKLLTPIKTALFGEKDDAGYIRDGLFSGIQNRMKESMFSLRRLITGKGYVTADGERVEDANEEEMKNTVAGKLKSMLNTVKTGIQQKLFGTEAETDENGNVVKEEKEGIVSKVKGGLLNATSSFTQGLHGWKVALFGEDEDDSPEKTKKSFKEAIDKNLPNAMIGVGAGVGANLLLGGSLLGMAINPVGGALLGLAAGVTAGSNKFKELLFGKDITDDNGEKVGRTQGLINDKMQEFFKKNGAFVAGGAALGGLKGAIFGTKFGLLGSMVGGPLAGALMGAGTAILTKTEMFQRFLHGDPKSGQLGLIKTVKNMFGNFGKVNGDVSGGKLAGMMGIGAAAGAITLGAISKAGVFGLALGPAGPIGGAILGLGASMLAQKDNFKEWLFGKTDENGNKTKEGILGQFKNMLTVTVFKPLATNFKAIGRDFKTFLEYDILDRFNLIIEPIGNAVFGTLSKLTGTAMDTLGDFGRYIREDFLENIVEHTRNLLAPITTGVKVVTNAMYEAGKHIVSAPLKLMSAITSPLVQSITGFIGGAIGMVGKTVNTLLIKPINTLVLKPLAKTVEIAGKVVAAPFKLVNKIVTPIITKTTDFIQHVGRFVGKLGEKMIEGVTKPFKEAGEAIKNGIDKVKTAIFDVTLRPLGNFIKSAATEIKDHIKTKVNGFFSKIGDGVKGFFKGIGGLAGKAFSFIGGKIGQGSGKLGDLWRSTAKGESEDYTGKELTFAQRRKALRETRRAAIETNKLAAKEDKIHDKNSRMIAKWTKNQVTEDTEENRELARIAARKRGKSITFEGNARETVQEKAQKEQLKATTDQTKIQEDTRDIGKSIHGVLSNILNVLRGKKVNPVTEDDYFKRKNAEINPETQKVTEEERMEQTIQSKKIGEGNASVVGQDSFVRNIRRKKHDRTTLRKYAENVEKYGLLGGLKQNFRNTLGQIKGGFNKLLDKHADGTDSADAGLAIVGEEGPEAIYGKDSKYGKLVGLGGPEVVQMKGGETVIPNSRIQKFADGTKDSDATKEVESIDDNTEEINNTLQGKVVNLLNDIKNAIGGRVSGAVGSIKGKMKSLGGSKLAAGAGILAQGIQEQSDAETGEDDKKAAIDFSSLTGESQRAAAEAQREADEDDARVQEISDTLKGFKEQQAEQNKNWLDMFGKNGLLVLGVLGLASFLKNWLKDFNLGDTIVNWGGNALQDLQFGLENLGDFKSVIDTLGDKVKDFGEVVEDLLNFNPLEAIKDFVLDENGNTDHESASRARFLGVQFAHLNTKFNKLKKGVTNFFGKFKKKGATDAIDDVAEKGLKNSADDIASATIKDSIDDVAETGLKNSADDVANATIKSLGDDATEAGWKALEEANGLLESGAISSTDDLAGATIKNFGDDATEAGWRALEEANGIISSGAKNSFDDIAEASVKSFGDDVVEKVTKEGAETIAKEGAENLSKNAATVVVKGADDIAQATSKVSSGLIDNAINAVKKFVSGVAEKIAKKTGSKSVAKQATSFASKIVGHIKSNKIIGPLVSKLAPLFTATAALASTVVGLAAKEVTWVVLGAVSGATGAKRLFRTDTVDGLMVIISTALGAFNGTTIGSICDVVNEVLATILGVDIYSELASLLYSVLAGQDAYEKLREGQEAFQEEYLNYKDAEISTQYDTMVKAGLIDGNTVSIDDYKAGLEDGTYSASVQSFSDYNDEQHKTLGSRALDGIVGVGKGIANGAKAVGGFFVGSNKEYYTDDKGNTYTDNGDGTYHVVTANGEEGDLAKEAIADILDDVNNKHVEHTKGILEHARDGIVSIFKKTDVHYATKVGDYYDADGNHFSANGDPLPNPLTPEEVAAMVKSGGLTEVEVTEPTFIGKSIGAAITKIKDTWKDSSLLGKVGMIVGAVGGPLGSFLANKAGNMITSFFVKKETRYATAGGDYYDKDGNHFSANGDELPNSMTPEELQAGIESGALTEIEVKEDTKLTSAIKTGFAKIRDAWKNSSGLEKVGMVVGAVGGPLGSFLGKKVGGAITYLFVKKETRYATAGGDYYDKDGNHFSANGDELADPLTQEELQAAIESGTLTAVEVKEDTKLTSTIKSGFAKIREAWKNSSGLEKVGMLIGTISGPLGTFLGKKLGTKADGALNEFLTRKETCYATPDGDYYDADGKHYTATGDLLEDSLTQWELQAAINSGALTAVEISEKISLKEKISDGINSIRKSWKESSVLGKIGTLLGTFTGNPLLAKLGNKAGNGISSIFTKKDMFYVCEDGSYYDKDGKHYSAIGEELGDAISQEELDARVKAGLLVVQEIKSKPADIKEALDVARENIISGWNTAKETISLKVSEFKSSVEDKAAKLKESAVEKFNEVKESVGGAINSIKVGAEDLKKDFGLLKSTGDTLKGFAIKGDPDSITKYEVKTISPIGGFINGIIGLEKMVFGTVGGVVKTGKDTKDKFVKFIADVKSDFKSIKSITSTLSGYAIKGDTDAIGNYSSKTSGPLSGFVEGVIGLEKMVFSPIGGIVKTGKDAKEKFVKFITDSKSDFGLIKSSTNTLSGYAKQGDTNSLTSYEVRTSDSPVSGFVNAVVGIEKVVMTPIAGIVSKGRDIKANISATITDAKNDLFAIASSAGTLKGYAFSGDTESIMKYEPKTTGPLSGFTNALVGLEKLIFSPIGGMVSLGKNVKNQISDKINGIEDIGASVKDFVGKLNAYTDPDKSMSDFASLTMEGANTDPVSSMLSSMIKGIMSIYVRAVRGIRKVANTITDTIDDIKNAPENFVNSMFGGGSGKGRPSNKQGGRGELNGSTYYSQNDPQWANTKYVRSDGKDDGATIGNSGCGPTAMSMIISDMNSTKPTPVELAQYAQSTGDRDDTGTNYKFISKASNKYGLISEETTNPTAGRITEMTQLGRPILLAGYDDGTGNSPYTQEGHYLVAVGSDENGNIIVNDPRGAVYSGSVPVSTLAKSTTSAWSFSQKAEQGASGKGRRFKTGVKFGGRGIDRSQWIATVQAVKKAIAAQKPGYSQSNWINITIGGVTQKLRTDCSGMVTAALQYYGVIPKSASMSTINLTNTSNDQYMSNSGFKPRAFTSWDNLEVGDILAFRKNGKGHTEIYAGKKDGKYYVWNCGSDSSVNNPSYTGRSYQTYSTVWSPGNPGSGAVTNLTVEATDLDSSTSYNGSSISSDSTTSNSLWDKLSSVGTAIGNIGGALFDFVLSGGEKEIDWSSVMAGSDTNSSSSSSDSSGGITITGSSDIKGSTNAEKIWNYLKGKGMPAYGIAGLMGNLQAESGLSPNNLQNSYERKFGMSDSTYTTNVNNGTYKNFVGDSAGYGLAQWTSSGRKEGLLNLAKSRNRSIDDMGVQLDWLWTELNSGYKKVLDVLMSASSVKQASDKVLHKFEAPADQSASMENKRASMGQSFYDIYANGGKGGRGTKGGSGNGVANISVRRYSTPMTNITDRGGHGEVDDILRGTISSVTPIRTSGITNTSVNVDNSNLEALLTQVVQLLGSMAKDSKNLSYLKDMKPSSVSSVNVTNNNTTNNIPSSTGTTKPLGGSGNGISNSEIIARKIAFGD